MKKFWNFLAVVSLSMAVCCESVWAAVLLLAVFVVSMQKSGNIDWMEEIMKSE